MSVPLDRLDNDALPLGIREIVEVIGERATLALVDRHGGGEVLVPTRLRDDDPLIGLLGAEAAAAFVARFAGGRVYIAKLDRAARALRNREIVGAHARGCPVAVIARHHGLSDRQVWAILAGRGADESPQMDLPLS